MLAWVMNLGFAASEVTTPVITVGAEWTLPDQDPAQWGLPRGRAEFTMPDGLMGWGLPGDD